MDLGSHPTDRQLESPLASHLPGWGWSQYEPAKCLLLKLPILTKRIKARLHPWSSQRGHFHHPRLKWCRLITETSSNCQHPLDHQKSKRVPDKHLFLLYWLHQNLWLCQSQQTVEILQATGIPDHLTCLLRNLYAGQEATVRTGHGTTDGFQIGKGVHQGCILSPCLFNLYTEYIMWYARLDEAQAGIKIAGRNINNLRYADDTTLMAENEEEPKNLLMNVKE